MDNAIQSPASLWTLLLIAFGAIGTLWKMSQAKATQLESRLSKKLDNCEQQHSETTKQIIVLTREVGLLTGRHQAIESIEKQIVEQATKAPRQEGRASE